MKKFVFILSLFCLVAFSTNAYSKNKCNSGDCNNLNVENNQQQMQAQGQNAYGGTGVGVGGSVSIGQHGLSPSAVIDLSGSFNSEMSRDFPIPGSINFPGTPSYFGAATPGPNFIPLSKLTMYSVIWDMTSIKNMVSDKDGWTKNSGLDVRVRHIVKVKDTDEKYDKIITTITKPKNATYVQQLAFGVVSTTDDHKISVDDFSRLLYECHMAGGNVIHFLAEGITRKMRASGWGVGINNSTSVVTTGQGLGNVSVGGLGYSNGTSGYVDRPWLQATFLKVFTKDGEPLEFEQLKSVKKGKNIEKQKKAVDDYVKKNN